jgi:hypothetical protein
MKLINAAAVKRLLLEVAAVERPFHKFNRVSRETLLVINETVRNKIVNHVKSMPSRGKTL